MKYLPYLAIALCLALLLGLSSSLNKEKSERKAMDRLHSKEIIALRGQIGVVDDKIDRITAEVADSMKPFSKLIPIDRGWLAVREEVPTPSHSSEFP